MLQVARVTIILLTEAHVTSSPSLRHADMVHQPQVDVQAVRASPPHTVLRGPQLLDQLHTAALALLDGGHVFYGERVVERVLAPGG